MPQQDNTLILRAFGPRQARMMGIMKQAVKDGCPGLNLLMKDGEYAICVKPHTEDSALAQRLCNEWEHYFKVRLGAAVFGKNQESLARVAVDALAQKEKLFVAADELTGELMAHKLEGIEQAQAVFDFGTMSYLHPKKSSKIVPDKKLEKKFPDLPLQRAVGMTQAARKVSDADWGVYYSPAQGRDPAYVLLCTKKTVYLKTLSDGTDTQELAAGWLLDMLRRLALGQDLETDVQQFSYGSSAPALILLKDDGAVLPQQTNTEADEKSEAQPLRSGMSDSENRHDGYRYLQEVSQWQNPFLQSPTNSPGSSRQSKTKRWSAFISFTVKRPFCCTTISIRWSERPLTS